MTEAHSDAFDEAFVAASALLGETDTVAHLRARVPLAAALASTPERSARAALLAAAVARAARELQQARPA
ncbi:MAG: hypothetical protein IT374_12815 [Polyangiaceae bacterium]|nr:hypothetical protein [Polyangiaceae bacterium]